MDPNLDGYTVYSGASTSPATSGYDPSLGFNVPTTQSLLTTDNTGTALDLSAGVAGGTPTTPATGNSLLDGIASLSALAVTAVSKGLGAYSSFLQSSAVANAANRLNTTPTAVTGAISTVPLTAAQQQSITTQQGILYLGIAAVAVYLVTKHAK